jgi:predicted acetyltransferase
MRPKGTLTVTELVAATADAYLRLWRYCCEVDLITRVQASDRPIDEPLVWLLRDGRALRQTGRFDFLWVRILDIATSLAGRRYGTEDRLVLEVSDPLGITGGRFALEAGPAGAACVPTKDTAELSMPVDALGALYMGGNSAVTLGRVGRIDEHAIGALARADVMFRTPLPPWCSTWF